MFDTTVLGDCSTYPYGYILNGEDKYIKEHKRSGFSSSTFISSSRTQINNNFYQISK